MGMSVHTGSAAVLAALLLGGLAAPHSASAADAGGAPRLAAGVAGAGAPTAGGAAPALSGRALGAAKAAADRPGDRSKDGWGSWKASPAEIKRKSTFLASAGQRPRRDGFAYPTTYMLPNTHQGQWYNNYCGPATLVTALGMRGNWLHDQGYYASRIGISPNNGGTGVDAMTRLLTEQSGDFEYVRKDLPYTPSSSDVATFKSRLMGNIYGYRTPVVGNSMEVHNGPHLVGHPNSTTTLYHWFTFQGYDGDWAAYLDSANTVWSSVPTRSGMPISTLVTIMGGRGYEW
ncbi:hypothetical protein [Streptomyces sp. NPDC093225]|uniref:hypothetical protein n=1 Tax=Streptomyces sp. NPDC093225 TaxID=3366034 RepID=UPI0037F812EE